MATGFDANTLESLFECSVCLERLMEPKTLPCQHSFCKRCLAGIVKQEISPKYMEKMVQIDPSKKLKIHCPNCKSPFEFNEGSTISALPTNLLVKQTLELLNMTMPKEDDNMKENCSVCCVRASLKCVDLNCRTKTYCQACFRASHGHGETLSEDEHFVVKLKEDPGIYYCFKHDCELIYFCEDCEEVACIDCFFISHKMHKVQVIDGTTKNNMSDKAHECFSRSTVLEMALTAAKQKLVELQTYMCKSKVELRRSIKQHKYEILGQVCFLLDQVETNLLEAFDVELDCLSCETEDVMKNIEITSALANSINSFLERLLYENTTNEIDVLAMSKQIQLTFKEIDNIEVFQKSLKMTTKLTETTKLNFTTFKPHHMPLDQLYNFLSHRFGEISISDSAVSLPMTHRDHNESEKKIKPDLSTINMLGNASLTNGYAYLSQVSQTIATDVVHNVINCNEVGKEHQPVATKHCLLPDSKIEKQYPHQELRIRYSRDFLLQLQLHPLAIKRPDCLPDCEIVLKEPHRPTIVYTGLPIQRISDIDKIDVKKRPNKSNKASKLSQNTRSYPSDQAYTTPSSCSNQQVVLYPEQNIY